jgi:hypothetical protein
MRLIKIIIVLLPIFLLTVAQTTGQAPDWTVNTGQYQGTMTITGQIQIDAFNGRSTEDMIGIFAGEECRGVTSPIYSSALDQYFVFVSVFGNEMPETMTFKVYEAARDSIYLGSKDINYTLNGTLGTIGSPYLFEVGQLPFIFTMDDKDKDGFFTDTDCDDTDPFINPGGFEIPGDQIDQNCNESLEAEIPQITYLNDFNESSTDFNTSGFSIRQEQGFDNGAMHSDHPYGKLFFNDTFNLFSILNIPIIVDDRNPTIRFKEIVLIEPGANGSVYPSNAFRDYVIVEARKADQVNWTPLVDAYDARAEAEWEQQYNANIDPFGGTSTATGNQTMYRERLIDISENFTAGDTIKIRFRLYSDYFDYGWGWSIDDLEVQKAVSTRTQTPFEANILQVYPNPLIGTDLHLRLDQFDLAKPLQIRLIDTFGKIVFYQKKANLSIARTSTLTLPFLPSGCYFLEVTDGIKRSSQKIIKTY